ncbi:MAG: glycosyltransferase [Acidobacteria bacterium]|nr:glycosyltransferase [Acidobacteriota bacterium]
MRADDVPRIARRRRVLYVSYDGALEPLGESQVVAYLEHLAAGADVTLLSFEKPADLAQTDRLAAMHARLRRAGVHWLPARYHRRPPVLSTALDVLAGCRAARRWARAGRGEGLAGIVHARGYVPALMALDAQRAHGCRFLFDMRGFWVDEKVEAGHWARGGALHRAGKYWERRFLASADAVVSLTHAGVRELPLLGRVRGGVPVEVIPTCADLERFSPAPAPLPPAAAPQDDGPLRDQLGLRGSTVVGYAGTLSNWYLREETLAYLAWLARRLPRARVLMVTREDHVRLREDAARLGMPAGALVLTRASFAQMPALLRLMHVGVFFIRACFSKRASAATRLAEFLGCGVPVVINDGIGDSGELVRAGGVGLVLPDATRASFDASAAGLERLLADAGAPARCREVAMREFSLTSGVARYAALYDRLP